MLEKKVIREYRGRGGSFQFENREQRVGKVLVEKGYLNWVQDRIFLVRQRCKNKNSVY